MYRETEGGSFRPQESSMGGNLEPVQNPYTKPEFETRPQKVQRMERVRVLLKETRDKVVKVSNNKVLSAFEQGKGGV